MPRDLPNVFARPAAVTIISGTRACNKCGYDLKGLKTNDRCPECGTPIAIKSSDGGMMTDAPVEYLRRLGFGAMLMAVGGVTGLAVLLSVGVFVRSGSALNTVVLVGLMASAAWAFGVMRVAEPRRFGQSTTIDPNAQWLRLRRLIVVTQWFWVGAFVFALAASGVWSAAAANAPAQAPVVMPLLGRMAGWLSALCVLPAFVGVLFTAVYLSFLADWANDLSLGMRLRVTPFCLALAIPVGVGLLLVGSLLRATARMVVVAPLLLIVGGAFLICIGFFIVPLIQFALLCHWARRNVDESLDRDRRASSNIVRRVEGGMAKPEAAPAPLRNRERTRPQGNYLAPGEGGESIALEEPREPA